MIQMFYEVVCDFCGCAVGHYTYAPLKNAKEEGAIVKKKKHFCDMTCCMRYELEKEELINEIV